MKKIIYFTTTLALALFSFKVADVYTTQDKAIFRAETLPQDFAFDSLYPYPFEEVFIRTDKDATIHGLHFHTQNPKGVVLYFHGRGWNLGSKKRGAHPDDFIARGYSVFVVDYRGFGKSVGPLSEKALFKDADASYDYLRQYHDEDQITVYGMSFGTGLATHVAASHNPKQLILECPYYSMLDMAVYTTSYIPSFITSLLLKYHLRTDNLIEKVSCPINIFHGTKDKLIPHHSATRLLKHVKDKTKARLISIEGGDHDHLPSHRDYVLQLDKLLN